MLACERCPSITSPADAQAFYLAVSYYCQPGSHIVFMLPGPVWPADTVLKGLSIPAFETVSRRSLCTCNPKGQPFMAFQADLGNLAVQFPRVGPATYGRLPWSPPGPPFTVILQPF